MTDKNWLTTKLPEVDKEGARRVDPTFGELLTIGVIAYKLGYIDSEGNILEEPEVNVPDLLDRIEEIPEKTAQELESQE